jgi:hypothetical protein
MEDWRRTLEAAEQRMGRDLAAGLDDHPRDFYIIDGCPDAEHAIDTFERLANKAKPSVKARLLLHALGRRVRAKHWRGFEQATRAAWRSLRGVSKAPAGAHPRPSLISRDGDGEGRLRGEWMAEIALAYGTFLVQTGRIAQGARVFQRLARHDDGHAKHAAETALGLVYLERGELQAAADHFIASMDVCEDDPLLALRGYSRSLLARLEAVNFSGPEFHMAQLKLRQRIR